VRGQYADLYAETSTWGAACYPLMSLGRAYAIGGLLGGNKSGALQP